MIVANVLAGQLGEQITVDDVRSDSRVSLLVNGWWANNFTVLVAIQRVFQAKIPKTAQRMSDERVFRDPAPANELLARFKELPTGGHDGPPPPPARNISILGQDRKEDEVTVDLLLGTAGVLGQQLRTRLLRSCCNPALVKGLGNRFCCRLESRSQGAVTVGAG